MGCISHLKCNFQEFPGEKKVADFSLHGSSRVVKKGMFIEVA